MNIDLFFTPQSEAALVCAGSFPSPLAGIILDAQTKELTLEFTDGSTAHLNIPMEETHKEKVLFAHRMFVGFLEAGLLTESLSVPLLYLNDPYGSQFGDQSPLSKPARSVAAFEQFMKRATFAQAVHRDNLGDEEGARSVLMGADPHNLKYSPALQRQLQLSATAKVKSAPQSPGLGGSATSAQSKQASTKDDGTDEKK